MANTEVTIFQTYSLANGQKTHEQVKGEIIEELEQLTKDPLLQPCPHGAELAIRVNEARKHLMSVLQSGPIILQDLEEIHKRMNRRQFKPALEEELVSEEKLDGEDPPKTAYAAPMTPEELGDALTRVKIPWSFCSTPFGGTASPDGG